MQPNKNALPSLVVGLVLAGLGHAQTPVHDRGPGELLPPQLRQRPPAGGIEADLTWPAFLLAFHGDSLRPESARQPLPAAQLAAVADALFAACRSADEELRWQSLWSLARIARLDAGVAGSVRKLIQDRGLLTGTGAVAEVAAVAAGLAARDDAAFLTMLGKLANDPAAPPRSRAFAFYGLGLAAGDSTSVTTQFQVLGAIERVLLAKSDAPAEVRVASLHALALTRIDVAPALPGPALALLESAWRDETPKQFVDLVAHVPLAAAAMLGRDEAAAEPWRERFAAAAQGTVRGLRLPESCVLALGALCRPWNDEKSPDARYGELLRGLAKDSRSQQLRNYAMFAMGVAGGDEHRRFLLDALNGHFLVRGWAAVGLAAIAASSNGDRGIDEALVRAQQANRHPNVREAVGDALRIVRRERDDDVVAAFLARYHAAAPGSGDVDARITQCLATIADDKAAIEARRLAAMALGHFADTSPRHWSAKLARAVDYRAGTAVLLEVPNGVLRLP